MRIVGIAGLALLLAGCQTMQTRPIALNDADQAKIRIEVMSRLKDPDSARFDRIGAGKTDSGLVQVCGVVSARNSFGGYAETAFQGWLKPDGTYTTAAISTLTAGASMAQAILNNCRADGVPI